MTINVELTPDEFYFAAEIGIQRQIQNILADRRDRYGCDPREGGWTSHIEGACSEKAVAKWCGLSWSGALGDLKADDVGHYQVRSSARHNNSLILHREDRDDRQFILVTGLAPRYVLRGWLLARDGKRPEFWRDPTKLNRHAFFVPQSVLKPMAALKRVCEPINESV